MDSLKSRLMKTLINVLLVLLLSVYLQAQCTTDEHSNTITDSWQSCQSSVHPVTGEEGFHWLQYDFGQVYALTSSHVWNYNVAGETGKGMRDVSIYASNDGENWLFWGNSTFEQASGLNSYTGFSGPNFDNLQTRWLLIVSNNNWGDELCFGLSEIRFDLGETQASSLAEVQEYAMPDILISPNPTSGPVSFESERGDIYAIFIMNTKGQIVLSNSTDSRSASVSLDCSGLSDGVYMAEIRTPEGNISKSLVIQH